MIALAQNSCEYLVESSLKCSCEYAKAYSCECSSGCSSEDSCDYSNDCSSECPCELLANALADALMNALVDTLVSALVNALVMLIPPPPPPQPPIKLQRALSEQRLPRWPTPPLSLGPHKRAGGYRTHRTALASPRAQSGYKMRARSGQRESHIFGQKNSQTPGH